MIYALSALFLTLNLYAQNPLADKVRDLIPEPTRSSTIPKTKLSSVLSKLGKAALVEKNNYYWIISGHKYGLHMRFDKNLLSYVHYNFVAPKPSIEKLKGIVDLEKFKSTSAKTEYLVYEKDNIVITINPVDKTIYSVTIK